MTPMTRVLVVLVTLSALPGFAEPEVAIECPAGTHFVKDKGCQANIAAAPTCPGGTKFDGKRCVAIVDTSCPAGMKFVAGTGCVASAESPPPPKKKVSDSTPPPPPPRPAEPAASPEDEKKGGTFSGNPFRDRLRATCDGITFEVHGGPRLTAVRAMLMANGTRVGPEEVVGIGESKHITGTVSGKAVDLRITQAVFGTRYLLKVAGTECKLGK
jgi:hypothetical protein